MVITDVIFENSASAGGLSQLKPADESVHELLDEVK